MAATAIAGTAAAATAAAGVAQLLTGIGVPTGIATVAATAVVGAAVYAGTSLVVNLVLDAIYKSTGLREFLIESLGNVIDGQAPTPQPVQANLA